MVLQQSTLQGKAVGKPVPDITIVITFNDAAKTHIILVAPLLKGYESGTTFICEFPPDFEDATMYMTWQDLLRLSKLGFENSLVN